MSQVQMDQLVDARMSAPFGMVICGPPKSGKSFFVLQLIENLSRVVDVPIDYIIWFYGQYNKTVELLHRVYADKVTTVKGLPENLDDYIASDGRHGLHVYDDVMEIASESRPLVELTTKKCSHQGVSWILMMQDFFYKGKERVTILRCAHYFTIFRNPLDNTIPALLANRLMPQNRHLFMEIFQRATKKPHGYLFLDGSQTSSELLRFRTRLFDEYQIAFVPSALRKTLGMENIQV